MLDNKIFELLTNEGTSLENTEDCSKPDCPAVLNQIWVGQLLNQQNTLDQAYRKKHSLEFALTPKILRSKLDDRSNFIHRVA